MQKHLHMPGVAMVTRDMTTCVMALAAARLDSPTRFPFSSNTGIPLSSSLESMIHQTKHSQLCGDLKIEPPSLLGEKMELRDDCAKRYTEARSVVWKIVGWSV